MSYFFFLFRSADSVLYTVFDAFSFNIDKAVSIDSSVNVFIFWDFSVHRKDCLTFSGGIDRPS